MRWQSPVDWCASSRVETPAPPSTDCIRDHGPKQQYVRWIDEYSCGVVTHTGCRACDEECAGVVLYDVITNPDAVASTMLQWNHLFGKE